MAKEKNLEKIISDKFTLAIKYTDTRFDELAFIVSDGFSSMEALFDQGLEQIESRLHHIDARLNMLEIDVADLRSMKKDIALTNRLLDRMVNKSDLAKIEKRVSYLEKKGWHSATTHQVLNPQYGLLFYFNIR